MVSLNKKEFLSVLYKILLCDVKSCKVPLGSVNGSKMCFESLSNVNVEIMFVCLIVYFRSTQHQYYIKRYKNL